MVILVTAKNPRREGPHPLGEETSLQDKVVYDYQELGWGMRRIARQYEVSESAVRNILRVRKIPRRLWVRTYIPQEEIDAVAELYATGQTVAEIAATFGISVTGVQTRLNRSGAPTRRPGPR